jgi:integrase
VDVKLHILRHRCASRLLKAGVDLYVVSKWLGRSSVNVTERYAHLAPDALDAALARLQRTLAQSGTQQYRLSGESPGIGTKKEHHCLI